MLITNASRTQAQTGEARESKVAIAGAAKEATYSSTDLLEGRDPWRDLGIVFAAQSGQHAAYRLLLDKDNGVIVYLPDSTYSPGRPRTTDLKEVCTQKTKQFRHTGKMKPQAYREYGEAKVKGKCCEVDHLIPLELGGADELLNLWPQPYPQAYWKDSLENWLHAEVCAGRRDLVETQQAIASNWYLLFTEMNSTTPKKDTPHDESPAAARLR